MRRTHIGRFFLVFGLLLTIALLGGCSSSSGRIGESEKAVDGFKSTKQAVVKAQAQVDKSLAALNQLSSGKDLEKSFATYNDAVKGLENIAADAKKAPFFAIA